MGTGKPRALSFSFSPASRKTVETGMDPCLRQVDLRDFEDRKEYAPV